MLERTCKNLALPLFLLLCLIMASLAKKALNITSDQSALLSLKSHITSDPFHLLSNNWIAGSYVCDWIGVTCGSRHNRVTSLNISFMGLVGIISPNLGNLSFLVSLDFSENSFHGSLPLELTHLRRLKVLRCGYNDLSGEIPSWIGSLSELQELSMPNNSFSGFIPPSLSNLSNLETLFFSFNSIEGKVPNEIGKLYHLKFLGIEFNHLSGSLPLEIFNISTLETIGFASNTLSGGLPNHMCSHLQRLEWLGLYGNELSGEIPLNLSQCSKLKLLELSKNNFDAASILKEIGNLGALEYLGLERNNLKGVIPKEIGNLSMLRNMLFSENNLTGEIPQELGNLYNLETLSLSLNNLNGHIPNAIFNLSMIRSLDVGLNSLLGQFPSIIGSALLNLEYLYLGSNYFFGVIPHSISNLSALSHLDLSVNNFMGSIPDSLGDLNQLETLGLRHNQFRRKISSLDLDFFTFLSKCKKLRILQVDKNPLDGHLPVSIGNLSKSVEIIGAPNCQIKSNIPSEIGNLTNLFVLDLSSNQLSGTLPSSIHGMHDLQFLSLDSNQITGSIHSTLCGLGKLTELYLGNNQIFGSLPYCLGNITSLRNLVLSLNRLTSEIPTSLWNLKDVLMLDLSSNYFGGSLHLKVENLKAAMVINLSRNSFSGDLPSTIGYLQQLMFLDLAMNKLQGSIPESIGGMISLKSLDLSHNKLSGSIPKSLENLQDLNYFNVSFNNLRGEIPSGGPFENFTSQSFIFNDALCGDPKFNVSLCPKVQPKKMKRKTIRHHLMFLLLVILAPVLVVVTLALVYVRYVKKHKLVPNRTHSWSMTTTTERISYHELLRATHGYDESNLIGTGSFGKVYKGILDNDEVVAIKVFNLQQERSFKSFEEECKVLCNVRHRNLTKVISCCSSPDFKALILEFMPNGSIEKWLYSHNYFLDIIQRLNIMIDVASALQYLHFGNSIQIVHCDLNPSNILLDQDMVAHVSDFGIAKLLDPEQSKVTTQTLATLGYIAPEYGLEGLVSTRCDVYSYGILLMEVFTRKKPSDEMFSEGLSLRDWVNSSTSDAVVQVIDVNLLKDGEEYSNGKLKCLLCIFEVALNCSMEFPRSRPNMGEVLVALEKIRHEFLQYQRMI